ncbi:hypothetical protein GCM10029992_63660 [Glycomyces albus]
MTRRAQGGRAGAGEDAGLSGGFGVRRLRLGRLLGGRLGPRFGRLLGEVLRSVPGRPAASGSGSVCGGNWPLGVCSPGSLSGRGMFSGSLMTRSMQGQALGSLQKRLKTV